MTISSPKTIHFIAGMPRSGSTLLCNILAQNPRFQVTSTSGILETLFVLRKSWNDIVEFKGLNNSPDKINVLRAMLEGYFADSPKPVIFDKSRSWLAHLELAETLIQRKAKVLVCVRDLREILSSFEKLWRNSRATGPTPHEQQFYREFQTIEGRCNVLMREDQVVGIAYNRIRDALLRGFRDRMHFIPFEKLTASPAQTFAGIYQFLGEEPFSHNFNHVEQVTTEDDSFYNLKGLHDIRPKVEPAPIQHPKILAAAANKWKGPYVWDPCL
ncbi:MAG: sulfotransferase [Phycisphaerales bacterium]|nr:sulfotransferase [Phycisphaerales bacterium]